ncbi:MAG: hypothetical protein ABR549_14610 [Mycobacteriales bacterium]
MAGRMDNSSYVAMSLLEQRVPLRLLIDLASDAETLRSVVLDECRAGLDLVDDGKACA